MFPDQKINPNKIGVINVKTVIILQKPFFRILLHTCGILLHISGNGLLRVWHILHHKPCIFQHKACTSPCCTGCLSSLVLLPSGKLQHTAYPVQYILPSFLHHLHVNMRWRNDYRLPRMKGMHQYNFEIFRVT